MSIKNVRTHLYGYIIYDLSYVMDFDTSHLFYINMSIKNARIHLYGYINMPYISRIKEGMTINMTIRIINNNNNNHKERCLSYAYFI